MRAGGGAGEARTPMQPPPEWKDRQFIPWKSREGGGDEKCGPDDFLRAPGWR